MEGLKPCCLCLNFFVPDRYLPNGDQMHVKCSLKLHVKKIKQVLAFKVFQVVEVAKHKAYTWISQWKIKLINPKEWSRGEVLRCTRCALSPLGGDAHTRAECESNYRTGQGNTGYIDSVSIYWALTIYQGFHGGSDGTESACSAGYQGQSLSWKDPLEQGMGTPSSILAWRISWTESGGLYGPWGHKE